MFWTKKGATQKSVDRINHKTELQVKRKNYKIIYVWIGLDKEWHWQET